MENEVKEGDEGSLDYFDIIRETAEGSNEELSISEITLKLAEEAGYVQKPYTFKKSGRTIMKTYYEDRFDEVLTAKWFLHFESLFKGRLRKRRELREFYDDIINETFFWTMRYIDLSRDMTDSMVNKYVGLVLESRIAEKKKTMGLGQREKKQRERSKDDKTTYANLKTSINYNTLNLDDVAEIGFAPDRDETSDIELDLKYRLKNDPIGEKLVQALLNTDRKVNKNRLDKFLDIPREEYTKDFKDSLSSSLKIITETLREYNKDDSEAVESLTHDIALGYSFSEETITNPKEGN